jgi:hypothetical protein
MKKIKLTESDLLNIIKRVINEESTSIRKTISLNCDNDTADGTRLTSQQISKWCVTTSTTTLPYKTTTQTTTLPYRTTTNVTTMSYDEYKKTQTTTQTTTLPYNR